MVDDPREVRTVDAALQVLLREREQRGAGKPAQRGPGGLGLVGKQVASVKTTSWERTQSLP